MREREDDEDGHGGRGGRAGTAPRRRGTVVLAIAVALGLALVARHALLENLRGWDYNAVRLMRTFVLAAGQSIYPGRDSGPILNAIYGPVGALFYLPVTVFRTPAAAILAAQTMSLLVFLLPALWLHLRAARGDASARLLALFGFLAFAALTLDLRPLAYVALNVHVDAPALALGVLAWGAMGGGRSGPGRWLAAGVLAALAVWTKQMMLPLLAALPLRVLLREGGWREDRRGTLRAAAAAAVAVIAAFVAVSAIMVLAFGPVENLVLNLWTVPSRHTVPGAMTLSAWGRGVGRLGRATDELWLLAAAVAILGGRRALARRAPLVEYGFPALLLLPFSLLGVMKEGGDVNALAYTATFLALGTTLELVAAARRSPRVRRVAFALPPFILAVVVATQEPESLTSWRRPVAMASLPAEIAYRYARAHPGETYFPRLTLASLLAEGEVYHQSVGLLDRRLADLPPSREQLLAHLPPHLEAIALVENAFEGDVDLVGLPELGCPGSDPELPGFVVYRRCAPPPAVPPRAKIER